MLTRKNLIVPWIEHNRVKKGFQLDVRKLCLLLVPTPNMVYAFIPDNLQLFEAGVIQFFT